MAKNEKNMIENLTLKELLEYKEAADVLYDYYVNLTSANQGEYNFDAKSIYEEMQKKTLEMLGKRNLIMQEIERRVEAL